jgi:hypothetical protein
LSLRACLLIATVFWVDVAIAVTVYWELLRQATHAVIPTPEVIALAYLVRVPPLWLLTTLSWRAGYDLARWPKLLLVNVGLALLFGLSARPSLGLATSLLEHVSYTRAMIRIDGTDAARALKLWGSSTIQDSVHFLSLQAILAGAAYYMRLRREEMLRERLATEYDRTRLQVLRMQTNPHFLFNTLSAIAGLIRPRPAAAESMVTRLGELFRATLVDRNAELVPLERELDLGTQYLEIQRTRFEGRFDYRIHVPSEAVHVLVPPLLLQPLLENAAEHGLTGNEGMIQVEICCSLAGDGVCIVISNAAPASGAVQARRSSGGFGLQNVRDRLRAAFGDTATLTTQHTNGGLFEARLDFPARYAVTS